MQIEPFEVANFEMVFRLFFQLKMSRFQANWAPNLTLASLLPRAIDLPPNDFSPSPFMVQATNHAVANELVQANKTLF